MTTESSLTPNSDDKGDVSRKAVVAGRWKLLRDALRGKPVNRRASFEGYNMILSRTLEQKVASLDEMRQNLLKISLEGTIDEIQGKIADALETSILSLLALDLKQDSKGSQKTSYDFSMYQSQHFDMNTLDLTLLSEELCRRCELKGCRLVWDGVFTVAEQNPHKLRVEVIAHNQNRFLIRRYEWQKMDFSENMSYLLIRERSPEQVISLAELTCHHRDNEIDNTGNVCVWDCEKTLLWAILSYPHQKYGRVLELGAGMAGLVALGLGAAGRASHIVVTDGNPGSLQSNRTHVRLMEADKPLACTVTTQLLPWALEETEESDAFRELQNQPADISVVSDCTHFERYHGHLLWTLVQCTAVGGRIWMCHPDRGRTLERFMDVVRLFVGDDTACESLLSLQEMSFPTLDDKHEQLTRNDPYYRPDVHRPRIFLLCKLREASENERSQIIHHIMAIRDDVASSGAK